MWQQAPKYRTSQTEILYAVGSQVYNAARLHGHDHDKASMILHTTLHSLVDAHTPGSSYFIGNIGAVILDIYTVAVDDFRVAIYEKMLRVYRAGRSSTTNEVAQHVTIGYGRGCGLSQEEADTIFKNVQRTFSQTYLSGLQFND